MVVKISKKSWRWFTGIWREWRVRGQTEMKADPQTLLRINRFPLTPVEIGGKPPTPNNPS